jgi:hypothetical protein
MTPNTERDFPEAGTASRGADMAHVRRAQGDKRVKTLTPVRQNNLGCFSGCGPTYHPG